jgi:large subunit ribosomal protein L34e
MLERRITYRRRSAYRTRSNNFKPVKTPGGKLVMHLLRKNTKGTAMQGVKVKRPSQFRKLAAR